jgi:transposase InsO family protein
MPWKEVSPMEQKRKLVVLAESGRYSIKELSAEFGVTRKTAHKWVERYREYGWEGLEERSRAPLHNAKRLEAQVEQEIVKLRRKRSTWGPKKLRDALIKDYGMEHAPCESTIGEVLKRNGLIKPRRRRVRGNRRVNEELTEADHNNHVWASDFKGWFRTGDGERCDPLTVSDLHSRYLIGAKALPQASQYWTRRSFEVMFDRYGLPEIMRVDNGSPFGSIGPAGLSKLSVWWISLGIEVQYSRPGKPQDNGSHERMHRTFKAELCDPVSASWNAQKQRMERWRKDFNENRPHESLGMRRPAQVYQASRRRYDPDIIWDCYRPGDRTCYVSDTGSISVDGATWQIGEAFAGMHVALREGPRPEWPSVWFAEIELGVLADNPYRRLQPTASASCRAKKLES